MWQYWKGQFFNYLLSRHAKNSQDAHTEQTISLYRVCPECLTLDFDLVTSKSLEALYFKHYFNSKGHFLRYYADDIFPFSDAFDLKINRGLYSKFSRRWVDHNFVYQLMFRGGLHSYLYLIFYGVPIQIDNRFPATN